MKFRWRKDFYEELEAAAEFYRQRSPAAIFRLLDEFERTLRNIRQNPQLGEDYGDGIRRRRVFGFPFDVIYMEHRDMLVLVALAHHSRRPGYWRSRLP